MITRRRVLLAVLAFFLVGVGIIVWTLAGLPPIKYYLRYGLDPYCEPTGETATYEGVEFVEIGPGVFRMGSDHLAEGGDWLGRFCAPLGLPWGKHPKPSNEMPVHWVEFRRGYWIATTEITNAQFERFDRDHERSSFSQGNDTPVVEVSWHDARDYCEWLAANSYRRLRLPSEAEWECACRAGSDDEFTFGDDEEKLSKYAWFDGDLMGGAHPVATKRANRWGLFDFHGNVWEWCEDTWHESYGDAPTDGSPWVDTSSPEQVFRWGCWDNPAKYCRSAHRSCYPASMRDRYLGFRPAFSN